MWGVVSSVWRNLKPEDRIYLVLFLGLAIYNAGAFLIGG
jgi:hypothetical protein